MTAAAIDTPCPLCLYPFDQDLLGVHGCPNCEGEGLHARSATGRAARSIRYIARELFADFRHALPWLLLGCLVMIGLTFIVVKIIGHCLLAASLLTAAVLVVSLAIPSRKRSAVKKHTKKA